MKLWEKVLLNLALWLTSVIVVTTFRIAGVPFLTALAIASFTYMIWDWVKFACGRNERIVIVMNKEKENDNENEDNAR